MRRLVLALCLLGWLAPSVTAAPAFIQSGHNAAFGTSPIDVTLTVTSGDVLVACGMYGNGSGAITFSTTAGSTSAWTNIGAGVGGFGFGIIGWASVTGSGSTTIRAALTSPSFWGASMVAEYSGVDTTSPVDGNAYNIASGTTANAQTSTNMTTTADGDLIHACAMDMNGGAHAYAAGTTVAFNLRENWAPTAGQFAATEDYVQPTHGTIAATMTNTGAGVVGPLGAVALKAGGGGGGCTDAASLALRGVGGCGG